MATKTFTPSMLRGAGTRGIPEIPAGSSFSSTKSLEFDGIDDYVATGNTFSDLDGLTKATWSIWLKPTGTGINIVFHNPRNTTLQNSQFLLWVGDGIRIDFSLETTSKYIRGDVSLLTWNAWNHILVCVDYTQANPDKGRIFVNGVDATTLVNLSANPQTFEIATRELWIGEDANGYQSPFMGNLDEFSIWAGTDQRANVAEIFNGGIPDDLDNLATAPAPDVWYRMGENSTFKTPQILMPENTNKDKVSNYSLDFDGTDDYVDCGSFAGLNSATALTVSVWFKSSIYTNLGRLVNLEKHVEIYQSYVAASNTKGRFYYKLMGNYGNSFKTLGGTLASGVGDLIDGDWHHLCFVWDNSTTTAIVYEDGVAVITNTSTSGTLNSVSDNLYIGADPAGANPITGNIDEVALWDTALSPTDVATVYGGGTPPDLTSLSPVTWHRMGEEATFVYGTPPDGVWTIPDQIGSNDGTSNNLMADSARVGTAPSSSNNTVSFNMDAADIDTDTPPNP